MVRQQNNAEIETLITSTSVLELIDKGLLALAREVHNLTLASAKGKLLPSDARDLRDTVKLLFELKDREDKALKSLPTETLHEISGTNGSDQ